MVEVDLAGQAVLGALDPGAGAGLAGHAVPERRRVGQAGGDHVAGRDADLAAVLAADGDPVGGVEAEGVERLELADEVVAEAVLEGDPAGPDPARDEEDLLVFHVDALDGADALGEVEDLRLAERFGGEPAALALVDHGRVQALLDRGPDVEGRGEVVALDGQVGAVADADLLDLVEEVVGGVAGEDVREAGLDSHADEGEAARLLPLRGPFELLVAELHAALAVRVVGVRAGEGHRHVEVVAARRQRGVEQGHHEPRVGGVHQDVAAALAEQPGDGRLVGGVDAAGTEAALLVAEGGDGGLGAGQVVVGDDEVVEEVAAGGDLGDRATHAAGTHEQNTHGEVLSL
ncbi:hypothetical protein EES37_36445 [Streptomyces sp. ADI91-18]|nr:hypothetical protein EES37_36445 [Streptomyces sp. ADI91-18]